MTGAAGAGSASAIAARRAKVLGCDIDRVDLARALAFCEDVIRSRGFAQHMAINVAKLVAMRKDDATSLGRSSGASW